MSLLRLACLLIALAAVEARAAETITVDRRERGFIRLGPDATGPLVIVLHGALQDAATFRSQTRFADMAARGATVIFADGLSKSWADGRRPEERSGRTPPPDVDDVRFLDALIARFGAGRAVHLVGASVGGMMALRYACDRAASVASLTVFIGAMPRSLLDACRPAGPVPLLIVNGTADPVVPFEGSSFANPRRLAIPPTALTIAFWRRVNGCEPADGPVRPLPDLTTEDRSTLVEVGSTCPEGRAVTLLRVEGGGHRLPSTRPATLAPAAARMFGAQNRDADAADIAWGFIAAQRGTRTQ